MADIPLSLIDDSVKASFWAKVNVRGPDECWHWLGSSSGGYGAFILGKVRMRAPRLSLVIALGKEFPTGMVACHRCDNPPCVNPAHLFMGTVRDNIQDAIGKGRIKPEAMLARNHNAEKSHCIHGHALTGENLIISKRGHRNCRVCQYESNTKYIRAKRAAKRLADAIERGDYRHD